MISSAEPGPEGSGPEDFDEDEYHEPSRRRSRRGGPRPKARGGGAKGGAGDACAGAEKGRVVSRSRGRYRVAVASHGIVTCFLRGRLKGWEAPVVGDFVRVAIQRDGRGVLEGVEPRRNVLSRVSEEDGETRLAAANIDLLVIVLAVEPFPPRWVLADRLLVLAEREDYEALIVMNKRDLLAASDPDEDPRAGEIERAASVYRGLGRPVLWTSAIDGTGLDDLKGRLRGRTNVLSGQSGVGKSSLLNALAPGLDLRVRTVNPATGKGRHATTLARLVSLPFGGYLVDTPGFREFGLGDVEAANLGRYYPEFLPIIGNCRFTDCLHRDEPGCALTPARERGDVSNFRYQNYLQILSGLVEKED